MNEITHNNLPEAVTQLFHKLDNIERLLLSKDNNSEPGSDQLLTIKQAAAMLSLSVQTLYGKVHRGEIPVSKTPHSKRLIFSKQSLTEWVKNARIKTKDEIMAEVENELSNHKRKK